MFEFYPPNAKSDIDSPIAMSEKNAPNQSMVKNPKSIPTTRPLLFQSSNGTGAYPMINSTAAITPTSVTGHDTPRRYGARMTSVKNTSMPAKKSASTVASRLVVQTRHFLISIEFISQSVRHAKPALSSNQPLTPIKDDHMTNPPSSPLPRTKCFNTTLQLSHRSLFLLYIKNQKKSKSKTKDSPPIPQTLRPTRQTKQTKALRLHLNRDIELLRDRIRPKGNATHGPQEHHGRWEALGRFGAVVADYLRDQLDAPAYRADCAQDVGRGGDGGLGGHS